MHRVLVGIGSNLGDRQANVLAALQRLRARCRVDAVSAFYESAPAGGGKGPPFLNVAARLETELEPREFERFARAVEAHVGRLSARRLEARPIDIDILAIDDLREDFGAFAVPLPGLGGRLFNVVPLAEIAPDFPVDGAGRAADLAEGAGGAVIRKARALHFAVDRQESEPEVKLGIDRAGVSGVRRSVRLAVDGRERVFECEFAMSADLSPQRAGVHMSRFAELLEEALLDVLATGAPGRIEEVAGTVARRIVETQKALRAEVRLRADFSLERWTPVSGKRGEETYALLGIARANRHATRHAIGVEAEGMTACPCAQGMIREDSLRELTEAGFSEVDANRALDALPMATHSQRGRGSILLGTTSEARSADVRAEDLVEIVEASMSSETYDLLKRPDEFFVVNKAHRNPKFVEDVVRGILGRALEMYADFPGDTFAFASQVNFESIHKHDAQAEAFGTFEELRAELHGSRPAAARTSLDRWLGAAEAI